MYVILKFIFPKVVAKKVHYWAIFSLLTLSSFAQFFAKVLKICGHYKPKLKFTFCKFLYKSVYKCSYYGTKRETGQLFWDRGVTA